MEGGEDLFSNSDFEGGQKNGEKEPAQSKLKIKFGPEKLAEIVNKGSVKIFVPDYEKRGNGMNAFIAYKIETKISGIPGYIKNDYLVWRRFSDFLGLREKLISKYQQKAIIVPYTPEISISSMTTVGENQSDLVKKRYHLIEPFLRHLTTHPRLLLDNDVRDFLSFESDLPKANFTSITENSVQVIKLVGDAFIKIVFPMSENDRLFDKLQCIVKELELKNNCLQTYIDNLLVHRHNLAFANEEVSRVISLLASREEKEILARTLSKLADTHNNVSANDRQESEQDAQQLAVIFREQFQLMSVLKSVFSDRFKGWQNWQNQQEMLTKKHEAKTQIERATQCPDEVPESDMKEEQMEEFLVMSNGVIHKAPAGE